MRLAGVDTPMGRQSFVGQVGREPTAADMPRMLPPEQIAAIILTMADPEMLAVTGTVVDTLAL